MTGSPRRPLVVADRGASADAPEHTIAAYELALDQGADAIALDVHLTRDGQPIVVHDFTVERTTSGSGLVRAHTTRELKRLDAGGWRDARFRGQRMQTLHEVLERFRERTRFHVEIRGGLDVYPDIPERVVSALEVYEVVDRTVVQSADPATLHGVRSLNPEVRLAAVAHRRLDPAALASFGPIHALCADEQLLVGERPPLSEAAGLDCYVRVTGASIERIGRWLASNVSGILTDRPSLARARPGRS
jgi:glycerophosphoryl diester phosphodiesterase